MKQTHHIGYVQTPSVKNLSNVKNALVENGLVPLTTPNEMLPDAIEKGLVEFEKQILEKNKDYGAIYNNKYRVRYFDADGTILKIEYVEEGGKLTPPTKTPNYDPDYLIFDEWNYDIENYVVEQPVDVGSTYRTKTGDTYLFIKLTKAIGLTIPTMSISGVTSIDWCDGTVDSNLTHTYTDYGEYVIKISGMTSITSYLFGSNTNVYNYCLQKCYLGNSVTSIGNNAFYNCFSLTSISIPNSVTSIGSGVLFNCYSLTSISIPNNVISICAFYNCNSLTSISIPNSVTSIGSSSFDSCYSLTSISIPNNVTSIEDNTFRYCNSLTSIRIPNNVTSIGSSSFQYCFSLTSISIPNNVTRIKSGAFQYCYSIINYIFNCNSVPTLSNANAFNGINKSATIWVKDELVDAYKSASNWSTYASYIKPISQYSSLTDPNAE